MNQKIEQFINGAVGKSYNPDGAYGLQCKDLADAYAVALFGNWTNTLTAGNAGVMMERANPNFFEKIYNDANNPNLIPMRGDLIIWGEMAGNPHGHIAIVESADANGVSVLEQDGFLQIPVRRKYYKNYIAGGVFVRGWLRPKVERNFANATPENSANSELKSAKGTAEVLVESLNVRSEPSTKSEVVANYTKGQTFVYDGWLIADGFVWLSYVGASGKRRYIAEGPHNGDANDVYVSGGVS